ncbi:MAG: MFS transporter [Anaerolineae bacterium]|nr:MFS transporter [Anaerolineae bacterium]
MQEKQPLLARKWLVLISVGLGVFLATIDGSIVNIGLNTMVQDLDQPLVVVEWVVLAYMLTISTLMISIGRLGDMIGKKPIYLTGVVIFTIGSGLCGMAPNVYWLIGFRVLQGVGASMTMALGNAIVTEAFPAQERGKALGIMGTIVSLGIIAGPTIGGIILESLSWHWLFFVNLPVGVAGVLMVLKFVPKDAPGPKQRFDYAGAAALFVCLSSFLLALSLGQNGGFERLGVVSIFGVSIIALLAFIRIEMAVEQPMIDLHIFKNVLFSVNLITGFMVFICTSGIVLIMPLYLQNVLGYGPRAAGLMLAVTPLVVAVVAPLSGNLSDRVGSRPISTVGLLIMVFGYLGVASLNETTTTLGYMLRFIPIGLGIGMFQSPNNSAVMGSVPRERLGVASGLLSLTRTIGQTTGIAILSAVWENRVSFHAGGVLGGDVTDAPAVLQVAGLQDTVHLVVFILIAAFLISLWALGQFIKARRAGATPAQAQYAGTQMHDQ